MARELRDVLHYFLDDEPGRTAPLSCPVVAAPCRREDSGRSALLWRLALEMRSLGRAAALVAPAPEAEGSGWRDLELEGLEPGFVPLGHGRLDRLARRVLETREQLAGDTQPLVLVQVPTDLPWPQGIGDLLGHCWLVASTGDRDRAEFLSLCERVLAVVPKARVGVTVRGADSLSAARAAFESLAELFEARFDRALLSYGLVLDEHELYPTVARRRAPGGARPGTRATRTLRDAAALLRGDLE